MINDNLKNGQSLCSTKNHKPDPAASMATKKTPMPAPQTDDSPARKPRMLLACDYDGTLFFHANGSGFQPADIEAARRFHEAGGLIGINTGRALSAIGIELPEEERSKLDAYEFDFISGSNGAEIVGKDGRMLYIKTIPLEVIKEADALLPMGVASAAADGHYFAWEPEGVPIVDGKIDSWDDLADKNVTALVALFADRDEGVQAEKMIQECELPIVGFRNLSSMDIVAQGCSKGEALARLAEHFGLEMEHVYAIGDGLNDLPALQKAGVGFAMASGDEELKALVPVHASSVADAIDQILRWENGAH